VNPRNPFKQDPNIDYEVDSEEEFEEMHGEDINSENTKEIEDEDMEDEEETAGWIVPDGYLSAEEVKMEDGDED